MPSIDRARYRGARNADRLVRQLGQELRDARMSTGVSQRHVARVAGLSRSVVGRAELARSVPSVITDLAVQCAALGLRLSIRVYPDGSPVRDVAQLRLTERFRPLVHRRFRWRAEVPIDDGASPRAWDNRLDGTSTIGIDAETRLHDIQALQRRCEAKWRDSGVDRIVLLVARTRHNKLVLGDHREALWSTFPADSGEILRALRAGALPQRNGLVML